MFIVDVNAIGKLISELTISKFYQLLMQYIEEDFKHWPDFHKRSRISQYHENGILELMPIYDSKFYANKYVCTYPKNYQTNDYTVMGQGLWVDATTGKPLMVTEMTLLTALRTGAISGLASYYMARKDAKKLAIIGCGAQSEFQIMSHLHQFPIEKILYHDVNAAAATRFAENMKTLTSIPCFSTTSVREACDDADIIITVTSANRMYPVLKFSDLKKGVHINAMGGDAPGSSELDVEILRKAQRITVEYFAQTIVEGEVQQLRESERHHVCEFWELITGQKGARLSEDDITIFDGVGFAILDFSILRLIWDLQAQYTFGTHLPMVPDYNPVQGLFRQLFKHEK